MTSEAVPKSWRGRFYEDFEVGDVHHSRIGRTISETDNVWFTTLTMNTNQVHFNSEFAARTRFGRPLVVEFKRSFMVYRRGAPQAQDGFPEPQESWRG